MGQTMAEFLRKEGRLEGLQKGRQEERVRSGQETLLRQLRHKFETVPAKTVRTIKAATDVKQLDAWLDRVVAAATLDDMHIAP